MGRAARVVKGVLEAEGEADIFMCMIIGIRLIMDASRTRRIFSGVWRWMPGVGLWRGMGGISGVGLIGCVRGMGCESFCLFCLGWD